MAATYAKPTKIPRWADTSLNVVEPSEGKKDAGWLFEEIPPSSWENWLKRTIGEWFKWLDERFDDYVDENDFAIKQPDLGVDALRLLNISSKTTLEFTGNIIRFDGSATYPKISFDGLDTPLTYFGKDSTGFRWKDSDVDAATLQTQFLYLFVDPSSPNDRNGMMLWSQTVSPFANMWVMNTQSAEDWPTIEYNEDTNSLNIGLSQKILLYETVGLAKAEFSLDKFGKGTLQYTGAGTFNGGELHLKNVNRTTAASWRWIQQSDYCFLGSYNGGGSFEKSYILFGGPTSDAVTFDASAELQPSTTGGKIGTSTDQWAEGHFGQLFVYIPTFISAYGSGDVTVTNGNESNVTPGVEEDYFGLQVDGSDRLWASNKGKYIAHVDLAFDVPAGAVNDPYRVRLYKATGGGGWVLQQERNHVFNSNTGMQWKTMHFFLEFAVPGTFGAGGDVYSVWVQNDTGVNIVVDVQRRMIVEPIAIYK